MPGAFGGKSLSADVSGPGTYRFLVGSAVLECQQALGTDDRFHAAMEFLTALADPILSSSEESENWKKAFNESLKDEHGHELESGANLPRMARYKQLAFIMGALRREGIFGSKKQEVDDATDFLSASLQRRNAEIEATT